jgi:hypothetical protein
MNDDVEQRMSRLTPRGVRPELLEKVLGAVTDELQAAPKGTEEVVGEMSSSSEVRLRQPPPSPWLRRAAAAVAASLLLGILLNIWVNKAADRRWAALFGPPPISKGAMQIAKDVARITDAETGQWVYRQLNVPVRPGDLAAAYAKYFAEAQKLMDGLRTVSKDSYHETTQEENQMDGGRPGRIDGNSTDCQRHLRLDYRCAA